MHRTDGRGLPVGLCWLGLPALVEGTYHPKEILLPSQSSMSISYAWKCTSTDTPVHHHHHLHVLGHQNFRAEAQRGRRKRETSWESNEKRSTGEIYVCRHYCFWGDAYHDKRRMQIFCATSEAMLIGILSDVWPGGRGLLLLKALASVKYHKSRKSALHCFCAVLGLTIQRKMCVTD